MPHVTLEYTNNVDQDIEFCDLFSELHQVLASTAGIDVNNCKSRAIRLHTYHIGEGQTENAFVHLEIQLLEGRPAELKREIGQRGLQVLARHLNPSLGKYDLQITLEVRDMQRQSYFKFSPGQNRP